MSPIGKEIKAPRALVADDYELSVEVARSLLEPLGWKIDEARDGEGVLKQAQLEHYDLILLDLHMPIMDGFEAIGALRELPEYSDAPIFAVTGDVSDSAKKACSEAGFDGVIPKPFRVRMLAALATDIQHGHR